MRNKLTTVDEVVDAFGGTCAAAERLGVLPSAVSNWRARSKIPAGWLLPITRELKALGKEVAEHVFEGPPTHRSRSRARAAATAA